MCAKGKGQISYQVLMRYFEYYLPILPDLPKGKKQQVKTIR